MKGNFLWILVSSLQRLPNLFFSANMNVIEGAALPFTYVL